VQIHSELVLKASKLLTSGNRFWYNWQYSSTNFTVGALRPGSTILSVWWFCDRP